MGTVPFFTCITKINISVPPIYGERRFYEFAHFPLVGTHGFEQNRHAVSQECTRNANLLYLKKLV